MAVENFADISSLVAANPADPDLVSEGAKHLRGIKQVLLTTFPGITGPLNASVTQDFLNSLATQLTAGQTSITYAVPITVQGALSTQTLTTSGTGSFGSDVTLNGNKITNVADGVNASDATNLGQVQGLIGAAVNGATSSNLTLSGGVTAGSGQFNGDVHITGTLTVDKNITGKQDVIGFASDERLKDFSGKYNNALEANDKIGVHFYQYKDDGVPRLGFSAQEIESAIPYSVMENESGIKHLSIVPIVAHLMQCVKELQLEVDKLKGVK